MPDTEIFSKVFNTSDDEVYAGLRAVGSDLLLFLALLKNGDLDLNMSGSEAQTLAKQLETLRAHEVSGFVMEFDDVADREYDVQGLRCTHCREQFELSIWTNSDTDSRIVTCSLSALEIQSFQSALQEGARHLGVD